MQWKGHLEDVWLQDIIGLAEDSGMAPSSETSSTWSATFLSTALSPRAVLVFIALWLGPTSGMLGALVFLKEPLSVKLVLACMVIGMAALVCLALFIRVPWLALDPWRKLTVTADRLSLERRGEALSVLTQDIRLLAAEGGMGFSTSNLVVFKTLVAVTRERAFRFRFGPEDNERCYELLKKNCPFAIAVSFDGQVRLPDFSAVREPEQFKRMALAVVAKEYRRQGRRGLLFGAMFICVVSSLALLSVWEASSGEAGGQGAPLKAWSLVAIATLGAIFLIGNGLSLMRRYRKLRDRINAA